jgi:radical SAM superfamily enzyme YgiQ (UPF0313 family)
MGYEEFNEIDHLVLGEAEITLPLFLDDLAAGALQRVYATDRRADIKHTPLPRWELIDRKQYASMSMQYSRGCPFNCDFCDITLLYGRETRTKSKEQVLAELEALYRQGWRGGVFFVDDNFVGNKIKLKEDILPAIIDWMRQREYPFEFNTQVSVNIADDEELMRLMVQAGFCAVFAGIETPHEESLAECEKVQNKKRDLIANVRKMQHFGFEVQAGFIVGFDSDPQSIFEKQIAFIQESGIVTAMVGLLSALRGTKLYHRLKRENRLLEADSGNNTDGSINFIPRMDKQMLLDGYAKIVSTIYDPKHYYRRVKTFLAQYRPSPYKFFRLQFSHVMALVKSVFLLGIAGKERLQYWRLLLWTLFTCPKNFAHAVTFAIYGYHYRKVFDGKSR